MHDNFNLEKALSLMVAMLQRQHEARGDAEPWRRVRDDTGYDVNISDFVYLEVHGDWTGLGPDDFNRISSFCMDAAWHLVRQGLLRPGPRASGVATMELKVGQAFSLTPFGREHISDELYPSIIPTDPSAFGKLIEKYLERFGPGFQQRAQEAIRCFNTGNSLACCAMAGASAESVMLAMAIAKQGTETDVLAEYKSGSGRRKIESRVTSTLSHPLKGQIADCFGLLKYWRDNSAHGAVFDVNETEAYAAITSLLRLCQLSDAHWSEIVDA